MGGDDGREWRWGTRHMIAGLEFLKSRRFWLVLTASTSAVTVGTVGISVMLSLYFPQMTGGIHGLFSMLAGFAFCVLVAGAVWFFYRSADWRRPLSDKHSLRRYFGVIIAAGMLAFSESAAVCWLLVVPILAGRADGSSAFMVSMMAANLFGLTAGRVIAEIEQATTMDAQYGLDEDAATR